MKYVPFFSRLLFIGLAVLPGMSYAFTLTQNDPYPLASAQYPWTFLDTNYKEQQKNSDVDIIEEVTHFSFTPFAQRSTSATDTQKNDITNLGDLYGKPSTIGLLYGDIPVGQSQAPVLTTAAAQTYQDGHTLDYLNYKDIGNQLGFLSIPLKYRKVGCRFEWSWRFMDSFVLSLQGGVANIKQTTKPFQDQTSSAATISNIYGNVGGIANLSADITTVQQFLTDQTQLIFDQLGYDVRNFNKTAAEDAVISLTWRDHFFVNMDKQKKEWSSFSIMPFVTLKGLLGFGETKKPNQLFGLPFGNNGHHGIQATTGLSFDFNGTLELSGRVGGTHFFKRKISNMFVPTSKAQSGIFPYATDVNYEPGKTWFFSVGCNSYRFLDKLTMYVEYFYIQHEKDSISLVTDDSAFVPSVLEDLSYFNTQGLGLGMSYELSPHISIGGVWQLPITQRNAYSINTITLNFLVTL